MGQKYMHTAPHTAMPAMQPRFDCGHTGHEMLCGYCLNNPLRYADPSGWQSQPVITLPGGLSFYTLEDYHAYLRSLGHETPAFAGSYRYGPFQNGFGPGQFSGSGFCSVNEMLDYARTHGGGATFDNGKLTSTFNSGYYSLDWVSQGRGDIQGNAIVANANGEVEVFRGFVNYESNAAASGGATTPGVGSGNIWDFVFGKGTVPYDGKAFWGTNFIGPGPNENPYTLKDANGNILQPKDLVDAAAQVHDYRYWVAGASGVKGAFLGINVRSADGELANSAYGVMQAYGRGEMDPWTGQQISERTYNMARAVYYLFEPITIYKTVISLTPNH
ncbi:MAG TPA: hypothetical protein VIO15_01240 [Bacteroidales bacterium]